MSKHNGSTSKDGWWPRRPVGKAARLQTHVGEDLVDYRRFKDCSDDLQFVCKTPNPDDS
jgi:hypothetical protein